MYFLFSAIIAALFLCAIRRLFTKRYSRLSCGTNANLRIATSRRNHTIARIRSHFDRSYAAREVVFNFFQNESFGVITLPYRFIKLKKLSFSAANLYSSEYCATAAVVIVVLVSYKLDKAYPQIMRDLVAREAKGEL